MSGDGLNAAHLGAIQTEALIRSCRTCIHRLMIPHEWSCKLSAFWRPSFFEEHNHPDKPSPAVHSAAPASARCPARFPRTPFSDKLRSLARSLSDIAHGLTDLDPRSKPSRNKPLHRQPYLPVFLSDQHCQPQSAAGAMAGPSVSPPSPAHFREVPSPTPEYYSGEIGRCGRIESWSSHCLSSCLQTAHVHPEAPEQGDEAGF
ncbi:hypothetical protein AMECASPLE_005429 [Ameca splendens]|uniref:Uncharacterized protein n=1 Tax=Ameca splendens TaxID=208324 RepID=A0ABV0YA92_9TELE